HKGGGAEVAARAKRGQPTERTPLERKI
ncbi:MAG: hypothetical protein RLZZ354_489, partial [Pseudomonadota bacterium]